MTKEQFQKHCEMQANWWIASALTKHTTKRKMFKSVNSICDTEMTDDEKISDAMEIANRHIRLFWESCNDI